METIGTVVKAAAARNPALASRLSRAEGILRADPPRRVYQDARLWHVPAVGRPGSVYLVDRLSETCTCPDFRQHRQALAEGRCEGAPGGWCKHRLAVEMLCRLLREPDPQPQPAAPAVDIEAALIANLELLA
jgi:hypothetical protein